MHRILTSLVALSAVAAAAAGQITSYQTKGNLAPSHDLDCITVDQAKNDYTPPDLMTARRKCYQAGRYEDGFRVWRLAGAYAQFDKYRVTDVTARDAFKVLMLNDPNSDETLAHIRPLTTKYITAGTPELTSLCTAVKRIGPPDYYPAYMIQHGLHAFTGVGGKGLVEDLDSKKLWKEVLENYLRCDVSDM